MNRLTKKIVSVSLSVTTAVWLSGAALIIPVASAQTTADLQAQIAALLAQIQALQSQLNSSQNVPSSSYSFTRDLTLGSKGDDVSALQQVLINGGYLTAVSAPTGYFGSLTKAALASWQSAAGVSPAAGYFGPKSRAALAASTPSTPGSPSPVPVPSGGFGLSVAFDNPMAGTVPKGATGVNFLKFNVSGNGTLDSLVFKRVGIGATADFGSNGVYLYEGNTRLTSGRSLNSTTHEVTFLNLGLAVNGNRTLWLAVDVASGATTGDTNAFQLLSATGSPTPSGTLMGSYMTVGGATVGGIVIDDQAAPVNPKVGQMGAKLVEFQLTASSTEDILVNKIALTEGGSIANSNLSNFMLKQAGNVVATAAAVGAKDLILFTFNTPFLLEKGQQRTFEVYGDVSGSTRSSDTVVLYVDSASDVSAMGKTYGYPVLPTIANFDSTSESDTLTVQGGDITITFNGPIAGDVSLRGQDVTVFDFTIASNNNVEFRNLRMHATTTALDGSADAFNDMKVWDYSSNAVITSATDVTTSTDVTYTDVFNINAGQTRRFKVTVDVDADNDDSDDILVSLLAFQSGDIRNLDNNTNVSTSNIVPNSTVSGNTLDTRVPTLDVQLSGTPTSQTYVRGSDLVPLVGFSFRATGGDVRLDAVRITATSSVGTLGSGELQSLALYDAGGTRISDIKSLDSTALNATFSGMNLTIPKDTTKVLTVKAHIDANAGNTDAYYIYLATAGTADITAYDKDGNGATLSGTAANTGGTIVLTVSDVGAIAVVTAPDDTESEAGIVVANSEVVLGKFKFTATNEAMTVNKFQVLVASSSSATATSSGAADEVSVVKLYDGSTQVGASAGYPVTGGGGADAGIAFVNGLGWVVPKDGNKTLTVKGVLNSIANGADTGASVYAHIMAANFEAQGATAKDTTISAASSNEKVVYKTKPTVSVPTQTYTLSNGEATVFKFNVKADGPETVSWRKVQFQVTMTGATMSAVDAAPAAVGNVKIKDMSTNTNLSISTAFSGVAVASTTQASIMGGNSGYVTFLLASEQTIAAGSSKDYEVSLTFANLSTTSGNSYAQVKLNLQESSNVNATTFDGVETATQDGIPSFIWSDNSATSHSVTSSDWANGRYVKTLPSDSKTARN